MNESRPFETSLNFLVQKMPQSLPVANLKIANLKIAYQFADPKFSVPGQIDMLLETESSFNIIKYRKFRITNCYLVFRSYITAIITESARQTQYCGFISKSQNVDECL